MKVLTPRQMRRIDEVSASRFGVSAETLMDNAGRAIAQAVVSLYPEAQRLNPIIVCGKGNNGGDGITAARYLAERGISPRVVLLAAGPSLEGAAAIHLERSVQAGVRVEEAADETAWSAIAGTLFRHGLIVDAVLGTGLRGAARGLPARVIRDLNECPADRIAIDIPSGLGGDTAGIPGPAVDAAHTIALAFPKVPHVLEPASILAGHLHVVDIGIPPGAVETEEIDLNLIDESEVAGMIPVREADSHKGDYGRLLVIAGSSGKAGAGAMVSLAALRSGVGLVTAATAASARLVLASQVMEMMTEALPETPSGSLSLASAPFIRALTAASDVLAIGPGLTAGHETASVVREIVTSTSHPVVLDADGINAFEGHASLLDGASRVLILTPHPGEMARLLSRPGVEVTAAQVQEDRIGIARSFARERSCYLVLKGHHTVVAEPSGQVWINPTGNPGMATAGSGDVLTGVLAGLLAQGLSPLESALLGVYAHGLAGDIAAEDVGETSLIARDLIDSLPEAFVRLDGT